MPSGYKKDSFGYYVDTAQGKMRIRQKEKKNWRVSSMFGTNKEGFKTLTEALTWVKEGWHVL